MSSHRNHITTPVITHAHGHRYLSPTRMRIFLILSKRAGSAHNPTTTMPSAQRPSLSFYGPRPVSRDSNDDIYESRRVYISRPRTGSAASSLGSTSSRSSLDHSRPQPSPECDSSFYHSNSRQSIRPLPIPPSSPQPTASFVIPSQYSRRKSRWLPVVPLPKASFPEIAPTECSSPSSILPPTLVGRSSYEEDDRIDWDLIDEIMATHH